MSGLPPSEAEPEAMRTQLSEINTRARTHVTSMWAAPLVYVGIVAAAIGTEPAASARGAVGVGLGVVGMLLTWAMGGWSEATHRAVTEITRVEIQLRLRETTQHRFGSHELPHFLMVVVGIVGAFLLASGAFQ